MTAWELILALGLPTAFTALCFWYLQRSITKREAKADEREKARQEYELLTLKSIQASMALGEATATALKNGHCNGETAAALSYATQIKHEQKEFIMRQGVKQMNGGK